MSSAEAGGAQGPIPLGSGEAPHGAGEGLDGIAAARGSGTRSGTPAPSGAEAGPGARLGHGELPDAVLCSGRRPGEAARPGSRSAAALSSLPGEGDVLSPGPGAAGDGPGPGLARAAVSPKGRRGPGRSHRQTRAPPPHRGSEPGRTRGRTSALPAAALHQHSPAAAPGSLCPQSPRAGHGHGRPGSARGAETFLGHKSSGAQTQTRPGPARPRPGASSCPAAALGEEGPGLGPPHRAANRPGTALPPPPPSHRTRCASGTAGRLGSARRPPEPAGPGLSPGPGPPRRSSPRGGPDPDP